MIFYITTLGCKVNQYESHALREAWLRLGREESDAPETADLILVNSCAVTAKAVADVRSTVRRLHRAAPQAAIVITGCAAESMRRELAALPGVTAVVGQNDKASLLERLPDMREVSLDLELPAAKKTKAAPQSSPDANAGTPAGGNAGMVSVDNTASGRPAGTTPPFPAFAVSGYDRSRAVLKVQDGCSQHCTYCIVPLTRGKARSRPVEESLAEARRLLAAGFREITVSGVNLRQYGRDAAAPHDFWDFIIRFEAALAPEWAGRARLRISSLEPGQLDAKALDVLAESRLIAPHLHLSLQSGSRSVLRRMGRGHYDPADIAVFLEKLQVIWPVFGLGADILTAFPGETEEEFAQTHALMRALPLTYAHVFPYSPRPGTVAADLPNQIAAAVKKSRAASLRGLVQTKKRAFLHSLLALPTLSVVFEPKAEQVLCGVSEYYADCRLEDHSVGESLPPAGTLTPVVPLRVENGMLAVRCVG